MSCTTSVLSNSITETSFGFGRVCPHLNEHAQRLGIGGQPSELASEADRFTRESVSVDIG